MKYGREFNTVSYHLNRMLFLFVVVFCLSSFHQTDALCTFPSALTGVWDSPTKGNLTFNDSYVDGYQIYTGSSYQEMTFECHLTSGSYYVIRSENFTVLGGINVVNAVTCLDLTQQTSQKFTYYLKTTTLNDAKYERVMFIAHDATVSINDVCNETASTNEVQLLIEYGTGASGAVQCPNAILGTYYYVSHPTCTASSWDVCSDLTKMQYNYTQCDDIMTFSVSGEVYCQYAVYSGNTAIFIVYNTDSNVNNSVNYQYTCVMAEINTDGNVYTSMYPLECLPNMTTTYVPSGGKTQVLAANITCVPSNDSEAAVANAGLIAGLVILFLVLIIGGAVAGYFIYQKKFKKVSPNIIDQKEKSTVGSARSNDLVTPSIVDPQIKSPSNGASHGKKLHKRIAIKRVERRPISTPPTDTKSPFPYKRMKKEEPTLITPRILKPVNSLRRPLDSTTPRPITLRSRGSTDPSPKVDMAPRELRLELPETITREPTAISMLSRATTIHEENISLKLLSEKSIVEENASKTNMHKSAQSTSRSIATPSVKPSSRKTYRGATLTVKPLKNTVPKSKRSRFKVEFKDTHSVYRKNKVRLVCKRHTPKKVRLDEVASKSLTQDEKTRPVSKESMYGFDLVKELKRPNGKLNLKPPKVKSNENEKRSSDVNERSHSNINDDGDSNFFMCSNFEEDVHPLDQSNNLTDSLKLNHFGNELKEVNSIVEEKAKSTSSTNKQTRTKRKKPEKWSFVREIERVAKTSFVKTRKTSTETNMLIKAKKEAMIEQKVLMKIYYNYDLKTKSRIKQRKRRNKRTVDLSKITNFARIPTLINWVEYTDILATPAMEMQKQINKKNSIKAPEPEIANQKYII